MLFDLLYLDGHSTMALSFEERRARLEELGLAGDRWQTPSYHRGEGRALLDVTRERGLEGIVAKRLDSPYVPGRRSTAWLKIKNVRAQEVVIGGWVPGKGRREQTIGALLAGYHADGGLRYAGKVGTGFSEDDLRRLARLLEPLRRADTPFSGRQPPRGSVFVEPRLVAEVEFNEWTAAGTLRHPSFKGLRDDKDPLEVSREEAAAAPPRPAPAHPTRLSELGDGPVEIEGREIELSNLDKVLYPRAGFTKGDVIDYYVRAAAALLPLLSTHPVTLKRYPNGVEGRSFYEKECPSWRPDWVRTAPVGSEREERDISFCLVDDLPTLVWAANLADLEMHTMLGRGDDFGRPTMIVFDLDPGEGLDVLAAARVAVWIRDMLTELGLESVVKSSGSKGLHVHVPLNSAVTYDDTKPFAQAVARLLEKQHPDLVVSRMTQRPRHDRVLVDWSQNSPHKSTVCAFSLRARERPTAATPLRWDEVTGAVEANDPDRLRFEAPDVLEQLDSRSTLFRPLLDLEQRLPALG
jgi:bifunctional non-homologous end joining protein LigD